MSPPWERITCIAWDFGGTLAEPGPSPDGAVVTDVLAEVFGVDAPPGFATVFDDFATRARHHARRTGLQSSWTGVLRDAAAVIGLIVPDGHAVEDAVFDHLPDATVDPRAAASLRRLHELGFECVLACNTQHPTPGPAPAPAPHAGGGGHRRLFHRRAVFQHSRDPQAAPGFLRDGVARRWL